LSLQTHATFPVFSVIIPFLKKMSISEMSNKLMLKIFSDVLELKKATGAKVVIFIRDPVDMVESFYKENIGNAGFFLDLKEYIDWADTPFVFYRRKPVYTGLFL
jgi:hypothetical protein